MIIHPTPPRTEDGREMVQPVTLDRGLWHWFHSAGDDAANGRAMGQGFSAQVSSGDPTASVTWQYNDWVEIAGGIAKYRNAEPGDTISLKLWFPATVGSNTPGTGNANKIAVGSGIHMFVPAANDGGDWTLTLDDRDLVCPVPASPEQTGYWDWSWPDTGSGLVNANANGQGWYNLFDFSVDPSTQLIRKVLMLGTSEIRFMPENVHPTDVLPHWKLTVTLEHGGGDNTLDMVWMVVAARKDTR
jgi:hypothetical protein